MVAQRYDLGLNAVVGANPTFHPRRLLSAGAPVMLPTAHLIPPLARNGIVINLPEMRMYFFPKDSETVMTYPIGIGRIGMTIPITRTTIVRKVTNPVWVPTTDIREYNREQGIILPKKMPAGPDNPLGPYAVYLGIPTYLIHSTIFPESIGRRASFGCIRMYEKDIQTFFPLVKRGMPVAIINMPTKVAWIDNHLYLESHVPLEEHSKASNATLAHVVSQISATTQDHEALVDWQLVAYLDKERDGVPHDVGVRLS